MGEAQGAEALQGRGAAQRPEDPDGGDVEGVCQGDPGGDGAPVGGVEVPGRAATQPQGGVGQQGSRIQQASVEGQAVDEGLEGRSGGSGGVAAIHPGALLAAALPGVAHVGPDLARGDVHQDARPGYPGGEGGQGLPEGRLQEALGEGIQGGPDPAGPLRGGALRPGVDRDETPPVGQGESDPGQGLRPRPLALPRGEDPPGDQPLQDPVPQGPGLLRFSVRPDPRGGAGQADQEGRLGGRELPGPLAEVGQGGRLDAPQVPPGGDQVQPGLQDPILGADLLQGQRVQELQQLGPEGPGTGRRQPDDLGGQGGAPRDDPARPEVLSGGPDQGEEVHPRVAPEAPVLHRDGEGGEIGAHLLQGDGQTPLLQVRELPRQGASGPVADPDRGREGLEGLQGRGKPGGEQGAHKEDRRPEHRRKGPSDPPRESVRGARGRRRRLPPSLPEGRSGSPCGVPGEALRSFGRPSVGLPERAGAKGRSPPRLPARPAAVSQRISRMPPLRRL